MLVDDREAWPALAEALAALPYAERAALTAQARDAFEHARPRVTARRVRVAPEPELTDPATLVRYLRDERNVPGAIFEAIRKAEGDLALLPKRPISTRDRDLGSL